MRWDMVFVLTPTSRFSSSLQRSQLVGWGSNYEVEQVLWHGLDSSTCSTNRVAILKSLKTLLQNVLGEGQVFIADADLSDIDYLVSLAGIHPQLFIIENDWKPGLDESWLVHSYQTTLRQDW